MTFTNVVPVRLAATVTGITWCEETLGERKGTWDWKMQFSGQVDFGFEHAYDAMMFKLVISDK